MIFFENSTNWPAIILVIFLISIPVIVFITMKTGAKKPKTLLHTLKTSDTESQSTPNESIISTFFKQKKVWILLASIAAIIISIIWYNNYQNPKKDGMRFEKESDGYVLVEYTGNAKLLEIPSKINGKNVVKIGYRAFYHHLNLEEIRFPDSITYIGTEAFASCANLNSIILPCNLTEIGDNAFLDCRKLSKIVFLDPLSMYNETCTLKKIGRGAFANCENLKTIVIPANVTEIGIGAFNDCSKLETIVFETNSKLKRIESSAFSGCSALKQIVIPRSVKYIGAYAFSECTKLANIEIHPSEEWVVFHDTFAVVSGPPQSVPLNVLQDSFKTAYYLVGDFSKYAWKIRE